MVENVDGLVRLVTDSGLEIRARAGRPLERGDQVYAIIRPEKIELALDGEAVDALEATVEAIDYLGAITYYNCRTRDGTEIIVARQNLGQSDAEIAPGQSLMLELKPEHVVPI